MLRILVVDDEAMHRRNLIQLLSNIYSEHILLDASDGERALEEVSCMPIDIVITDIRMPNMDGLELIGVLHRDFPSIKVIILSAYSEFSYAKQALRNGAVEYVLKPICVNELKVAVDKVVNLIHQEQSEQMEKDWIERRLGKTLPVYIDYILTNLLLGRGKNREDESALNELGLSGAGYVLVCDAGEVGEKLSSDYLVELKAITYQSFLPNRSIACKIQDKSFLIAVTVLCEKGAAYDGAEVLMQLFQEQFECSIFVALGSFQEDLRRDAMISYQHARFALQFCFYESDQPLVYEEIACKEHLSHIEEIPCEGHLRQGVSELKNSKIISAVNAMMQMLTSNPQKLYFPDVVKQKMTHNMQNILHHYEYVLSKENQSSLSRYIREKIYRAKTVQQLSRACIEFLQQLACRLENERKHSMEDRIHSICQFIEQNYQHDLTLDYMAEQFYLNRSYFSTSFKTGTGKGFSKYLHEVRMVNAKEMLLGSTAKVQYIAKQVGFKDASYFARTFRSYYGISPDEYRKVYANNKVGIGYEK